MAYMNQEKKAELAPAIKAVFKKYSVKGTISVRDHVALCVTIKESPFAIGDCVQVNHYTIDRSYEGECRDFLNELHEAMTDGNHDDSDSQVDYFDVGWYVSINFGTYEKPHRQLAMA
jgi:hypothetical protein